jgi:hypothetical protein
MFQGMRRSGFAATTALLVLAVSLTACAGPVPGLPTDVISVPGSYTFVTTTNIYGRDVSPRGTVAFCLDAPTRLRATTEGDSLSISFGGQTYFAQTNPFASASPLETPVVGPGCGLLSSALFRTYEGSIRSMTVWIEPIP